MNGSTQIEGAARPRRPLVSRRVSPLLFAAIIAAFALPFGTVSCEGPPVTFTGYQLATWRVQQTTPPATTDDGKSLSAAIESSSSLLALIMLACAVVGLVLGFAHRLGAGFAAATGLTVTTLLWLRVSEVFSANVQPRIGFELATCFYVLLAVWHVALRLLRRRIDPAVTTHEGAPVR